MLKAALIMVVRNEEALIAHNIRYHHAIGFDIIGVLDHCSTDCTPAILATLAKNEHVKVFRSDDPVFDHAALSNLLLCNVLQQQEVDWVFPIDADEFLYLPGGVHAFLRRMIKRGVRYGSIPWINALSTSCSATDAGALVTTKFYHPWPERNWQHEGMFRKAFCAMHDAIEIVVGGHYFRKENNPKFFGKEPAPILLRADDACIYHYEFRDSVQALMSKWRLLADHEFDSSSRSDAPWLERLTKIRTYVEQWLLDPDGSTDYWSSTPRTFWGTPIPPELIKEHHHIAEWAAEFAGNQVFPMCKFER